MQRPREKTIPIFIFGKKYGVPEELTIQKAIEFSGYQFIRSCGCRGGICGACLTEYRVPGRYQLKVALACQALIEPGMQITQAPFIPMNRAHYHLEELKNQPGILGKVYPEIYRCLQCNTCTRVCPMELSVMNYIAAAIQGDVEKVATLSFECVMCGACASKCPAEISQPNMALLARRIYGRHILSVPNRLHEKVSEIEKGRYDRILGKLTQLNREELIKVYMRREQEPQDNRGWVPHNPGFPEVDGPESEDQR